MAVSISINVNLERTPSTQVRILEHIFTSLMELSMLTGP
jgi:hypothetical protein